MAIFTGDLVVTGTQVHTNKTGSLVRGLNSVTYVGVMSGSDPIFTLGPVSMPSHSILKEITITVLSNSVGYTPRYKGLVLVGGGNQVGFQAGTHPQAGAAEGKNIIGYQAQAILKQPISFYTASMGTSTDDLKWNIMKERGMSEKLTGSSALYQKWITEETGQNIYGHLRCYNSIGGRKFAAGSSAALTVSFEYYGPGNLEYGLSSYNTGTIDGGLGGTP